MLLLVLLWAAFRMSGLDAHFSVQFLHDQFERHKLGGLLVFIGAFALGNLVQIPGWVFLASAVLALGRVWGGVATYVAACATCITTFWIIRLVVLQRRWNRMLKRGERTGLTTIRRNSDIRASGIDSASMVPPWTYDTRA